MKLYRVIIPVGDIEQATSSYRVLLDTPGKRVSPGRHYFDCGGVIFACYDAVADGDHGETFRPNPDHVYLACDDLEIAHQRVTQTDGFSVTDTIAERPWGERSFYVRDPWNNPICFVDEHTIFTG